jgi:glycosyltransferase involved in cell wall biosynthesis
VEGAAVQPPRVVLLIHALRKNGAVHLTIELARRWAPYAAVLAVLVRPFDEQVVTPPPEVRTVQLSRRPTRLRRALLTAVARRGAPTRRAEALVVGSEIGVELIVGYVAARAARRSFVIGVHADLDEALREWVPRPLHRLFYWVHRHADGAVCVAPALVAPLVRNGLAPERVRMVRNGIDPDAVRRAAAGPGTLVPRGSGQDGQLPVVVATGRLARQKGYDLLLEAHARVVADVPHRLLILNDGPEGDALRARAQVLGITGSVEFAGAVASPLPSVADADLFCLPSRHEGLPLALLEALVLGVPVIAADSSDGVRDALDQGRVGELVPVEDVDALAAALARHLTDPTRLRERARLGPAHADTFDGQAMAAGWAAALRDFIRPSPGRPISRSAGQV